jgi:IS605 OrfB family transposase
MSHDLIAFEDLKIANMVRNPHLAKSINDAAWSQFLRWVCVYGSMHGIAVIKVAPHYTSQDCSACGTRVKKSLSVRTHICTSCGVVLDRDQNAARNILDKAKDRTVGHTGTAERDSAHASGQGTATSCRVEGKEQVPWSKEEFPCFSSGEVSIFRIVMMQRASHDQGMLLHQRLEKIGMRLSDLTGAELLSDHGIDARDDNLLQIGGRDLLVISDLDQALAAVQFLRQLRRSEVQLGRELVNDLIAVISGKCAQGMLFLPTVHFSRGGRRSGRGDAVR